MGIPTLAALGLVVAAATQAITGVGSVTVAGIRVVPPTTLLATVALTNGTNRDFTPAISRFYLTTPGNERFAGTESGSSAFVGVANSHAVLKMGEKRTYVVGFRVTDPVVSGTISYEP